MKQNQETPLAKRTVFVLAISVLLLWLGLHVQVLFSTQHGLIRCALTILFSILIAIRPKPKSHTPKPTPLWLLSGASIIGALLLRLVWMTSGIIT